MAWRHLPCKALKTQHTDVQLKQRETEERAVVNEGAIQADPDLTPLQVYIGYLLSENPLHVRLPLMPRSMPLLEDYSKLVI